MNTPTKPARETFIAATKSTLSASGHAKPSMHVNWEDWLPFLEECDAPHEDKMKMIEALWSLVLTFVDAGWDVTQSPKSCGQNLDLTAALGATVLDLDQSTITEEVE